jgi:hypothetical protein
MEQGPWDGNTAAVRSNNLAKSQEPVRVCCCAIRCDRNGSSWYVQFSIDLSIWPLIIIGFRASLRTLFFQGKFVHFSLEK